MESSQAGSSLVSRAKEILAVADHKNAATLISQMYQRSNDQNRESANILYRFCAENFPNSLTLMLLKVCQCSVKDPVIRSQSLTLLHSHLNHLYDVRVSLMPESFEDIKSVLVSCLLAQETTEADFKILSRIVSRVALDVFLEDSAWDELCNYITGLADHDLKKAFYIFSKLPTILDNESLMLLVKKLFPEILKCLNPPNRGPEDWILALETGLVMAVQLVDSKRDDLAGDISYAILSSACELVRNGMEVTLQQGLLKLTRKVDKEGERFHQSEYRFVSSLALKMENMKGIAEDTKNAAKNVHQKLQEKCWDR